MYRLYCYRSTVHERDRYIKWLNDQMFKKKYHTFFKIIFFLVHNSESTYSRFCCGISKEAAMLMRLGRQCR